MTHRILIFPSLAIIILSLFALGGCAATTRHIANPSPPKDVGLKAAADELEVELHHVIVPDGPGSWVKGAKWTEWVVSVKNLRKGDVTIYRINLIDSRGAFISPDYSSPYQLETASEIIGKGQARSQAAGAATTAIGYAGMALGAATGIPLLGAIISYAGGTYAWQQAHTIDAKDREAVVAEFKKRTLPAYLQLSGGGQVKGSVFFPIVPEPQSLVVTYRHGEYGNDGQIRISVGELSPASSEYIAPRSGEVISTGSTYQAMPSKHRFEREEKRLPVECVTPTRTMNPPGFKFEILDPKLASLYRRQLVSIHAGTDPRFFRADHLQKQGLVDAAYVMLLDLLCEWPDALSKNMILASLAGNREGAGDLEAAIWFTEKHSESEVMRGIGRATSPEHVLGLLRIAEWYTMLGDNKRAKEKIAEAESILGGPQGREVRNSLPEVYLALAKVYVLVDNIGRSQQLIETWKQAAADSRNAQTYVSHGGDEIFVEKNMFLTLVGLGRAYIRAGEYTHAERIAKQVLRMSDRTDQFARMIAFEILARISIAKGDGNTALRYGRQYEEARASYGRVLDAWAREQRARQLPEVRKSSAEFYRAMTESVKYTERAQRAHLFGKAFSLTGQPKKAATKFLEAVEVIESLRGFVGDKDRLAFFAKYTGPYYSLVGSLLRLEREKAGLDWEVFEGKGRSPAEVAFYYAEAARARLLSEQITRSRAGAVQGKLPPKVAQNERELLGRANAELRRGVPFDQSAAFREFQAFVQGIRKTYTDYANLKYPLPVNVRQVPLMDKEALLAYSLLEKRVAVWLLQKGKEPRVFQISIPRERVLKTISVMRASLEPDSGGTLRPFDSQASGNLYQWLLAEPLKSLSRGSRIIIVPDSALSTIPFEALTVLRPDGTMEFAGERYNFSYSPSVTVLTHLRTSRSPRQSPALQERLLAVGDPVYDEDSPRGRKPVVFKETTLVAARMVALRDYSRKRRMGIFSRLPGTNHEVKQIATALGVNPKSPHILLGIEAQEHKVKGLDLARYRYLHFATHGVLAQDLPYLKQPALVLSQVGDLRGEDGFLTMEEVLNLNLRADLTVLSACQTGLGQEISGEGIIGLMRAFLYAGSRSVLVSLWRVSDRSTADLMVNFYRYIAQGLPLPEALSRAKHDLRIGQGGRFAHPFYWAPFILFGSD